MDSYLWTSFLFFVFVLFPCDAVEKVHLTAVVGSSIRFPDPLTERGFLNFGINTIASVSNGAFEVEDDVYRRRLHWTNSTGHFTLSDLKKKDSGLYGINSKKGNVFLKSYELKLYEAVAAPVVSCVNVSADSFTLQCSVTHTEQTTLSWFRGGHPVDSSSSAVLPLTVQLRDNTSHYQCVAQNPAENKTVEVDVIKVCEHNETLAGETKAPYVVILVGIASISFIVLCLIVYIKRKYSKGNFTSTQTQDSVHYAQINHHKRNKNQSAKTSAPPDGSARPELITVYDEIQEHRMGPINCNSGQEIM